MFRPDRPVGDEAVRIARQQLRLAIDDLRGTGPERLEANVAAACRHLANVRALIRLVAPALRRYHRGTAAELSNVVRDLQKVADTDASLTTLDRLAKRARPRVRKWTVSLLRGEIQSRQARADDATPRACVLNRVVATLRAERRCIERWRVEGDGFLALAKGFESTYSRARTAMGLAAWERCVEDHWLQVRLLGARTRGGLTADEANLRRLLEHLSERRSLALLSEVLTSRAVVSRDQTARVLRTIRVRERELEHGASIIGRRLYAEPPEHVVRRVHRMWDHEDRRPAAAVRGAA